MATAVAVTTHDPRKSFSDRVTVPHQNSDEQLVVAHTIQARDPNGVRLPRWEPLPDDILVDENIQDPIAIVDDDDGVPVVKRQVEGALLPTQGYRATRGGEKQEQIRKELHCNLLLGIVAKSG